MATRCQPGLDLGGGVKSEKHKLLLSVIPYTPHNSLYKIECLPCFQICLRYCTDDHLYGSFNIWQSLVASGRYVLRKEQIIERNGPANTSSTGDKHVNSYDVIRL